MKHSIWAFGLGIVAVVLLLSFSGISNDGVDGFFGSLAYAFTKEGRNWFVIIGGVLSVLLMLYALLVFITNLGKEKPAPAGVPASAPYSARFNPSEGQTVKLPVYGPPVAGIEAPTGVVDEIQGSGYEARYFVVRDDDKTRRVYDYADLYKANQ